MAVTHRFALALTAAATSPAGAVRSTLPARLAADSYTTTSSRHASAFKTPITATHTFALALALAAVAATPAGAIRSALPVRLAADSYTTTPSRQQLRSRRPSATHTFGLGLLAAVAAGPAGAVRSALPAKLAADSYTPSCQRVQDTYNSHAYLWPCPCSSRSQCW